MLTIGICGGSGCGKTTVVNSIRKFTGDSNITIISQDSYYKDNKHLSLDERKQINFDHPDSIEFELLLKHIDMLKDGEVVEQPQYSFIECVRLDESIRHQPRTILIIEGILIFTMEELRDRMDIKVFVDADADDRLMRIVRRDMMERGRSCEDALSHYETFVKPMHQQFIEPGKRYADIIIPQGGRNTVAIEMLAARILREQSS